MDITCLHPDSNKKRYNGLLQNISQNGHLTLKLFIRSTHDSFQMQGNFVIKRQKSTLEGVMKVTAH